MDQRIIDLYDRFTHGDMNRRDFLDRLAEIAGSTAAAIALLPLLQNDYAQAAMVSPNDGRLAIDKVSYEAAGFRIDGYLARLKDKRKRPAVIVIHENRGRNPHIEDVARRMALEGFLVLSPDLLSVAGGTPAMEDDARALHAKTDKGAMLTAALAAIPFMKSHAESAGKVGAMGFCYGGGVVNAMVAQSADLNAGVAYYGAQAPADKMPAIKAALLLHYASLDQRINAGIAAYEAALKANGKDYTIHMYEGVNHAFNNDTGGRYDKAAAELAWQRTVAFFKKNLS